MTVYRTCWGCASDGPTCPARAAVRDQIRGLGVTSIKWRCKGRVARFKLGDAVWARTVGDMASADIDPEENTREDYPGHVVRIYESQVLVYIPAGSMPKFGDDYPFVPNVGSHGFCKIPMSRITNRDAESEVICPKCELPASQGHIDGYSCSYAEKRNYPATLLRMGEKV